MKQIRTILRFSALVMLIAVTAYLLFSCGKAEKKVETGAEITITVTVIGKSGNGNEHVFTTTRDNLGDALLDAGIVEGTLEQYGLYILSADGEVADYSADQSYWALSKDGEMLMTGASQTPIADGDRFELTYTIS